MVLALFGRIPKPGERVEWGGWSFEVSAMDDRRITYIACRHAIES